MMISTQKPQGRPRTLAEIPRQQLQQLPQEGKLAGVLESTFTSTVGDMQRELGQQREQGTRRGLWGAALTAGAAAVLGWQGNFAGSATSLAASLAGVAGLGLFATGAAQSWGATSKLKTLEQAAQAAEERSLQQVEGKLLDRRFMLGDSLSSALEVSDVTTGKVTERVLQVDQLTAREDVASGQVILSAEGKSISFPGTIEMPTRRSASATISHPLATSLAGLDETQVQLGIHGDHWLRISGPTQWDEEGVSYSPGLAFAGPQLERPGTANNSVQVKTEEGTFTFQSPLDLEALAAGQLRIADDLKTEPMQATLDAPPPPPPPRLPLAEYVEIQQQANQMLELRGQACQRYLETESRYANLQVSASALDAHKAELKDLAASWKLLSPRPEAGVVAPPADTVERRQLNSLQLELLEVRGQALEVQERSGRLRDGLYQARGPREAATALLNDVAVELNRVESLLKEEAQ